MTGGGKFPPPPFNDSSATYSVVRQNGRLPHRFGVICMCMIWEENKDECGPGDVTVETTPVG